VEIRYLMFGSFPTYVSNYYNVNIFDVCQILPTYKGSVLLNSTLEIEGSCFHEVWVSIL
jgi:hypothetical protein